MPQRMGRRATTVAAERLTAEELPRGISYEEGIAERGGEMLWPDSPTRRWAVSKRGRGESGERGERARCVPRGVWVGDHKREKTWIDAQDRCEHFTLHTVKGIIVRLVYMRMALVYMRPMTRSFRCQAPLLSAPSSSSPQSSCTMQRPPAPAGCPGYLLHSSEYSRMPPPAQSSGTA